MNHLVGKSVDAIDTPTLVVDLDRMERNLRTMAAFAAEHKVLLRPHAKMHKSAELAKLQIASGAVGVCVQKTSEAEALIAGGVHNIFISNEVIALHKLARVAALTRALTPLGGKLAWSSVTAWPASTLRCMPGAPEDSTPTIRTRGLMVLTANAIPEIRPTTEIAPNRSMGSPSGEWVPGARDMPGEVTGVKAD